MKLKVNIKKNVLICLIIGLFTITTLALVVLNTFKQKDVILDDVKLRELNNNNRSFAIMISDDGRDFKECDDETCKNHMWPTEYVFNKSTCYDDRNEEVPNAVTFDNATRKATVTTTKTVYCTLYFTKDGTAPVLTTFYINTQDTNKYTNTNQVTIHMAWSDSDVKEYCITTANDTNGCVWTPTKGVLKLDNISHTLSQTGLTTLYGFIRDNANNVSQSKSDSITYDTGVPTITSFYIKNTNAQPKYSNASNKQETATVTWNDDDIAYYCIINTNNVATCDTNSNWKTASNKTGTLTLTLAEGSNTYYAFLKDKAGNKSTANTSTKSDTIILDTKAPTITEESTKPTVINETNVTITAVASDVNSNLAVSGVKQICYGMKNTNTVGDFTCINYNASGATTFKIDKDASNAALKAGSDYTYYVYATDNAGNGGPTNKVGLTFKTKANAGGTVSGNAGSEIQSNPVSGDNLKRFQGSSVTKNYICFGTSDKTACTTTPGTYMYRIMGIDTTTNQLKIIKKEALDATYKWHSSYGSDSYTWNNVMLYKQLNGIDTSNSSYPSNIFLTSTNPAYVPNAKIPNTNTNWADAIENHTWSYGDITTYNDTATNVLKAEQTAWANGSNHGAVQAKIGLMYLSDYYLAVSNTANCSSSGNYSECAKSWIFIGNNDTSTPGGNYEWTMSRHDSDSAWAVNNNGYVYDPLLDDTYAVRPVFYLKSTIVLEGTGEITDPYRITGI